MPAILKRPYLAKITIKKNDGTLYTYDPHAGANPPTTGTYDFRLASGHFKPAFDISGGDFEFKIFSADASNSAMNTILSNIKADNEVTFWGGKTTAGLVKVMLGKIETIEIEEPTKALMYATLKGPDWGSDIIKNLIINRSWIQKKDIADQNKFDVNDKQTTIGQITKDIMTDPATFADKKYPVTPENLGVIVTAGNYPDPTTSLQITQFEANMERINNKLNELDEIGGTISSIDADKTFFQKPSTSLSLSGVLLTDDENDSVINPTYNGKVGFITPGAKYINTVENHKAELFGVGASTFAKDQSKETVTASTSLAAAWKAQRFTPIKQDCYSIGVYVGYTGNPTDELTLILIEDNNNLPTGSILRTVSAAKSAISLGGSWIYFPMQVKLNTAKNYWVVLAGNSAGNSYVWYHDNVDNSPSISATSTNGTSWSLTTTPNRFNYSFVEFANDPLVVILPTGITSSTKHLHQEVYHRPDLTDSQHMLEYLQGIFVRLGKQKEIFRGRIYAPDQLLKANQVVRIRKQQSGKVVDGDFVLGQLEYFFDSSDEMATGTMYVDIEASRFVAYP